jgi:flagellar capping protein FliD
MTDLLARYNKQFAAMESMVGQTKSLQTNLKSTFEGMMAAYTNK